MKGIMKTLQVREIRNRRERSADEEEQVQKPKKQKTEERDRASNVKEADPETSEMVRYIIFKS